MLANDRKTSQYFKGILIHADEWEAVEALNDILEVIEMNALCILSLFNGVWF